MKLLIIKLEKPLPNLKKEKLNNFKPAIFILITGSPDETGEDISENKQKLLKMFLIIQIIFLVKILNYV